MPKLKFKPFYYFIEVAGSQEIPVKVSLKYDENKAIKLDYFEVETGYKRFTDQVNKYFEQNNILTLLIDFYLKFENE